MTLTPKDRYFSSITADACEGRGLDEYRIGPGHPREVAELYGRLSTHTVADKVAEFHDTFYVPARTSPGWPSLTTEMLRIELLIEEFKEYRDAIAAHDLVEIADALADMVYVIYGTALSYGIPLDAVIAEVHRSNMTKLDPDGNVVRRDDGKILKPSTFEQPRIREILENGGRRAA